MKRAESDRWWEAYLIGARGYFRMVAALQVVASDDAFTNVDGAVRFAEAFAERSINFSGFAPPPPPVAAGSDCTCAECVAAIATLAKHNERP